MDAPLPSPDALIRPWRTATLVASLVAAIELVLLVGAAVLLLAKPLAHAVQRHAEASALAPPAAPAKKASAVARKVEKAVPPKHLRSHTGVFVLNGNGRNGAASVAAAKLSGIGYLVPGKGNAKRTDYATSVVMYRRGWEAEGRRLASDLHVKVVGPLDGISSSSLHGAQLVVVLGAR
ncbi:MAG TPA: LytR C-terminal domain-containing protein [Gaiellaceae bacterium]|nr:LytR C-terminal domain-containing protein [Gaiellaceae bacterium]